MISTQHFIKLLFGVVLMTLLVTGSVVASDLDDSELFVDGFNAYQKKDYLLTIEKIRQVSELFPDTPLRDVSLLLLARAALKSGDYELAAKTVNQFSAEFIDSSLRSSLEDDLVALGVRKKKGEKLVPNKLLQIAAQKVRSDQVALERAAALKAQQMRLAREKEELDRIAHETAETERKEHERVVAEKTAKESIKLSIVLPGNTPLTEVGKIGQFPVELINKGPGREEFLLSTAAPSEYFLMLASSEKPTTPLEKITLAAGEKFNGFASFRMPSNKVDGHKIMVRLKAASVKFSDVVFFHDTRLTASAPLVRAVIKPLTTKVSRGEVIKYRVTALNAGSIPAQGLVIRVVLPEKAEFIDATGGDYRQESAGVISFKINSLETGRLAEFHLNVRVRESAAEKEELRCQVEITNAGLQLKETFASTPAVVWGK